jgi:hypothetical protein
MYKQAYWSQKCTAGKRNIPWEFTYETWLAWWGTDIDKRGRGKGKLVMARYGDVGPYSITNCKKITFGENISEAQFGKPKSAEWCLNQSTTRLGVKRGSYKTQT